MFYGYCKVTDNPFWPTGLAFGTTHDCQNMRDEPGELINLVPAKRGDEIVAYALQNDEDRAEGGVFFLFYPGLFHRDIVEVRDFAMKNAVDRDVIPLTLER